MKPLSRDGVITANGLTGEFRFVMANPRLPDLSIVEIVTGEVCVPDSWITYDPVKDLTPEAAAVVEASKEDKPDAH